MSLDGRVNAFINFSQGDKTPEGVAEWTAGLYEPADPNSDKIAVTRIRSGFVTNVLGFNIRKQLTPDVKVTGRIGLWMGGSNERKGIFSPPAVDPRELYIKIEAPWGMLLAGRNLGLFARGGVIWTARSFTATAWAAPVQRAEILGGACGFVGHGVLFPYFNAGFLYGTPNLSGFQATVGLYDPSINSEKGYEITRIPRVEAQLSYNLNNSFKVFGEAMWQRLINTQGLTGRCEEPHTRRKRQTERPDRRCHGRSGWSVALCGSSAAGWLVLHGQGRYLGDSDLQLADFRRSGRCVAQWDRFPRHGFAHLRRHQDRGRRRRFSAQADAERQGAFRAVRPPKQQLGISVGLYQTFYKQVVWALEYFRGQYSWYDYQAATEFRNRRKTSISSILV